MMHKKQSGAVLIVSLIILVALTLFVLSGSNSVVMQEKMTSAVRDMHVSLEIAESGLRDAEDVVKALSDVTSFNASGTNGLYSEGNGPTDIFADALWSGNVATAATTVSGKQALYFIEHLGVVSTESASSVAIKVYGESTTETDIHRFKIVARSTGTSGNAERTIVSYYSADF